MMDWQSAKFFTKSLLSKYIDQKNNRDLEDWYYFLHIPKTAGTTFRYVIYEGFKQAEIYPNYYELNAKQNSTYLSWKSFKENEQDLFPKSKRWLIGHFGWAPLRHYDVHPPRVLVFFRKPIDRVKSSIIYHRKRGRVYSELSMDEILNNHSEREGLMQARQLGYRAKANNQQRVLKNLEKVDFIGISEQFERSLELCNAHFGWNLANVAKRNVGKYSDEFFTSDQLERIEEACSVDQVIYNKAVQLFEERCAKYGI